MRSQFFDNSADGLALVDAAGRLIYVNASLLEMLSLNRSETESWLLALRPKLNASHREIECANAGGKPLFAKAELAPVRSDRGAVHLVRVRNPMNPMSMYDDAEPEGVYMRDYWQQRLATEIEIAKCSGAPIATMMLMLDHGTTTQSVGRFLRHVVELAVFESRASDMYCVFDANLVVASLYETQVSEAVSLAERIRSDIGGRGLDHLPVSVTVSVGVAALSGPHTEATEQLNRTMDALLVARKNGGDQMRLYLGESSKKGVG